MSNPASEAPVTPVSADGQPRLNGAAAATPQTAAPSAEQAAVQTPQATPTTASSRAEEMVDNMAVQVAVATSYVGKGLLWLAARCREEASDIWAEAQNLRRGDKS